MKIVIGLASALAAVGVTLGRGAPTMAEQPHVTGVVILEGQTPAANSIDMSADEFCVAARATLPTIAPIIVDANGRVADVLVYVKEGLAGTFPEPTSQPVLEQVGCQYRPRVIAMRTNQPLVIRNGDDTFHNVHAFASVNRGFNVGQPIKGMLARRTFAKAEIGIDVKCDVHGWMRSHVHVMEHPFYAVTGADGSFDLGDLPPGDYVVEAWHAAAGPATQRVAVEAAKPVVLEFLLKAK